MAPEESYRRRVTELVEAGWRIDEETADRVTLVKRNFGTATGHIVVAVLTIWWLMGLGNVLYAAYKLLADSERTVVWKDGTAGTTGRTVDPVGDTG